MRLRNLLSVLALQRFRGLSLAFALVVATLLIVLFIPASPTQISVLMTVVLVPVVVAAKRRHRLMLSLALGAIALGCFAISSSVWSINSRVPVVLKISEPGKLVIQPGDRPDETERASGLGCRAIAVLADGWRHQNSDPILRWELVALPGFVMREDGEYQPLGIITIGPRRWLDTVAPSPIPFLIEPVRDSEDSHHVQTRIRLPAAADHEATEYTWRWDPASLVGWAGQLDWQSEQLNCICDYDGVSSHAIPANKEVVLEIVSGPVAIIPTEPRSFWLDHPSADGIGEISVTTLASESPMLLDNLYDRSRSFISYELQPVADVWRELSTDASKIVVTDKRVRMDQGPFLLLGEQGSLSIGGDVVAKFDSSFFAIVEPWTPYGEFRFDSLVLSFLALNDDWACDCPLLWLYGEEFNEKEDVVLTVLNSLGELRIGDRPYQFEEHDEVRVEMTPISVSNRRLHPSEYVLAGEARSIAINGRSLIDSSYWNQLPSAVQQVILLFLGACLTGAIGVLITTSRGAPAE